eukprot:GEMP01060829.1.p1 GENE.GEMP01060829.1~~GEMP01060829.1.p1  ORF type:complete len:412 (+),score=88.67 GEMP01060829.1:60-1295(+)
MSSSEVFRGLTTFYWTLVHFLRGGRYDAPLNVSIRTRVHLYGWALTFYLWDQPHYRNEKFSDDLKKNLRNVAVPGTGVPLSALLFLGKYCCIVLFLLLYPLTCAVAATIAVRKCGATSFASTFCSYLLSPDDWFSYWQLNCRLASFHALKSKAEGYKMEDKQAFVEKAEAIGIPVTPSLQLGKSVSRIVLKDRNEEGGMGMRFFHLTQGGGPWIAQQAFTNSTFITTLVPSNAPLSTFRVITMSRLGGLEKDRNGEDIVALSCVFRAGRANAETDHRCIMFDCPKGVLASGTTNAHWYCLGARKTLQCARWFSEGHEFDAHPDSGKKLKDASLGDRYAKMLALCTDAHRRLLSDVPLAGWDVALTGDLHESGEEKMILLEVNLSCNFFRGSFDQEKYFQLVNEYFIYLDGK